MVRQHYEKTINLYHQKVDRLEQKKELETKVAWLTQEIAPASAYELTESCCE